MASRTVHVTNTVKTSRQIVSPQQSTQAIQIMMTSTISTIAFLRELLPERYFIKRVVWPRGESLTYDDFVKDKPKAGEGQPAQGSTTTMVFKRGASQRADQILQLLASRINRELWLWSTDIYPGIRCLQSSQAWRLCILSNQHTSFGERTCSSLRDLHNHSGTIGKRSYRFQCGARLRKTLDHQ